MGHQRVATLTKSGKGHTNSGIAVTREPAFLT
jgi:hypothetical protein